MLHESREPMPMRHDGQIFRSTLSDKLFFVCVCVRFVLLLGFVLVRLYSGFGRSVALSFTS